MAFFDFLWNGIKQKKIFVYLQEDYLKQLNSSKRIVKENMLIEAMINVTAVNMENHFSKKGPMEEYKGCVTDETARAVFQSTCIFQHYAFDYFGHYDGALQIFDRVEVIKNIKRVFNVSKIETPNRADIFVVNEQLDRMAKFYCDFTGVFLKNLKQDNAPEREMNLSIVFSRFFAINSQLIIKSLTTPLEEKKVKEV